MFLLILFSLVITHILQNDLLNWLKDFFFKCIKQRLIVELMTKMTDGAV